MAASFPSRTYWMINFFMYFILSMRISAVQRAASFPTSTHTKTDQQEKKKKWFRLDLDNQNKAAKEYSQQNKYSWH